jgi:hypothetical protein
MMVRIDRHPLLFSAPFNSSLSPIVHTYGYSSKPRLPCSTPGQVTPVLHQKTVILSGPRYKPMGPRSRNAGKVSWAGLDDRVSSAER